MAAASLTQGFSTGNGERGFSRSVSREACDVAWRREATDVASSNRQWSSLLLIIPLRLGLTDVNPTYFVPLKVCCVFVVLCYVLCCVLNVYCVICCAVC